MDRLLEDRLVGVCFFDAVVVFFEGAAFFAVVVFFEEVVFFAGAFFAVEAGLLAVEVLVLDFRVGVGAFLCVVDFL